MAALLGRALGIILLILLALSYFLWPFLDDETAGLTPSPDWEKTVEINWTWKINVKKTTNAIYGTIRNKGQKDLKQVILEFSTQNKSRLPVSSYTFTVDDLPAGEQKPFRQDFIRTGTEDSGFVKVTKVIPQ